MRHRVVRQYLGKQSHRRACVTRIAGSDFGGRDDFRVGVNRDVPFIAIETTCRRFVAVPRFRVDRRDNAVRRYAAQNSKRTVLSLLEVLAYNCGEEFRRRLHLC